MAAHCRAEPVAPGCHRSTGNPADKAGRRVRRPRPAASATAARVATGKTLQPTTAVSITAGAPATRTAPASEDAIAVRSVAVPAAASEAPGAGARTRMAFRTGTTAHRA